jgi:hypothetical protein
MGLCDLTGRRTEQPNAVDYSTVGSGKGSVGTRTGNGLNGADFDSQQGQEIFFLSFPQRPDRFAQPPKTKLRGLSPQANYID